MLECKPGPIASLGPNLGMPSKLLKHLLISARPRQWLKNLALLAAAFFWGNLFDPKIFVRVLLGAGCFCLLSSAVYLFNDVIDLSRDRLHPLKKHRPIASGQVPVSWALGLSGGLALLSLAVAYRVSFYFFVLTVAYVLLQVAYSLVLRDVIILDVLAIALGFIFRVFAGALILPVPLSSWLVLTTIGLALLMAFGKRRCEKTILASSELASRTRSSLLEYPDTLLDSAISTFAAFTLLSYSIFAFQTSPRVGFTLSILPPTLARPKWMMLTIPIVIYGVARYWYVIYEKGEGESPANALLSDRPLLLSIVVWAAAVGSIIYGLVD